ncbi:M17 family metallopeptidase [Mycoplasmopsis iners]|uniref:M17 family metallopeptidase n=1 Tax=Mycoplasmopsis iners TaxID=76630 RepID=UPI00049759C3|nr:M17 family metallopeptidase [Mycoplasmopsis iners]
MELKYLTTRNENLLLKAQYSSKEHNPLISTKHGKITDFFNDLVSYIYLDESKVETYSQLVEVIDNLLTSQRPYQIDVASFANEKFDFETVLKALVSRIIFKSAILFNKKKSVAEKTEFSLFFENDMYQELFNKFVIIAENRNKARNLQIMPENYCNSEQLANYIVNDFSNIEGLKLTVLDKKAIQELKMGLILSVNQGSTHEPRVVVIEYNGNPDSKDKTVLVGKGITFDTGGVNTKGYHMEGMKYDMSGSVIVAYAVKSLAQLKVKKNVAAVMMITDNRLDGDASLPENVYESMAGISVEVTDTDAEGRLVLADGLYYGATKLNATLLIDVATLTGTILTVLGNSHSGIYATDDENWSIFNKSAEIAHEKVWRMPFHEDFNEGNKSSLVADLLNYSSTTRADSNHAAMFLKEFTNEVPFIHCDVAGTADTGGKPQGVLIDTLVEFVINK